jgi:hypothetical protein
MGGVGKEQLLWVYVMEKIMKLLRRLLSATLLSLLTKYRKQDGRLIV